MLRQNKKKKKTTHIRPTKADVQTATDQRKQRPQDSADGNESHFFHLGKSNPAPPVSAFPETERGLLGGVGRGGGENVPLLNERRQATYSRGGLFYMK